MWLFVMTRPMIWLRVVQLELEYGDRLAPDHANKAPEARLVISDQPKSTEVEVFAL